MSSQCLDAGLPTCPVRASPQDSVAMANLPLGRPWLLPSHPDPGAWLSLEPNRRDYRGASCAGAWGKWAPDKRKEAGPPRLGPQFSHPQTVLLFLPPAASRFQPLLSTPPWPSWSSSILELLNHSLLSGLLLLPLSSFMRAWGRQEHLFFFLFPS